MILQATNKLKLNDDDEQRMRLRQQQLVAEVVVEINDYKLKQLHEKEIDDLDE